MWGVRGTLRAGAGSLWDEAETLAQLLTRAGASVEFLEARTQTSTTWTRDHLFRNPIDPPTTMTEERGLALRAELGLPPPSPRELIDRDDVRTSALLLELAPKLTSLPALADLPQNEPDMVPVLRVTAGGRTFVVDMAEPGLPSDQTKTQGSLLPSTTIAQDEVLEVSLLAVDATRPSALSPLVTARVPHRARGADPLRADHAGGRVRIVLQDAAA